LENGGEGGASPGLGPGETASLGSTLEGTDFSIGASLTSLLGGLAQELRFGFETSSREYTGTSLPATALAEGGIAFGTDATIPGEFNRSAIRLSQTLHFSAGRHRLKLGAAGLLEFFEHLYAHGRDGEFLFGGTNEFGGRDGVFVQAVGAAPVARFNRQQYAFFLQDTWSTNPTLDVTFGLRYEFERLPDEDLQLNETWQDRTGISNASLDGVVNKFSPRFGFLWDVGGRGEWFVRGGAGIYHDLVDPALLAEFVSHDGGVEVRRGVGVLSSWPAPPASDVAPIRGPRLTLPGPDFQAPRTGRVTLAITRALEPGTTVQVSGVYRHTDFLPRRHDLNLAQSPVTRDQYDRSIWGEPVQRGAVLAVEPGTNRLFEDFDLVSAINPDGFSDYWGGTVTLERQAGERLNLLLSYTFSRTEDNWLMAGGPDDALNPFPDSLDGVDWAEGRSGFDIPHRVVVATEVRVPEALAGVTLAGFYRFRSGSPFTPGFRPGVDANGDGSARNDPAFVDPAIPGTDALLAEWGCLRDQTGQFAERNSCRAAPVHRLDFRLGVGLFRFGTQTARIVVDALDVLDSDLEIVDRALYLVDRERSLSVDPEGRTIVPLVANPEFGEPIRRFTSGRRFRLGLQISF
jgi:hypothetical protein